MAFPPWQLQTPISAITFDCDGTLSAIEGIDELAKNNNVYTEIHALTAEAMGKTGINPEIYEKRLRLVNPQQSQVLALGDKYFELRVPYILEVITLLKKINKPIYIISAGLLPAVRHFGQLLHVPQENIYAVDIQFDGNGQYVDFDRTSPLIHNNGKQKIIATLKNQHKHIAHIGDGLNDMLPPDLVTRLIGYGGTYFRENIAALCNYYIATTSMLALLPLILTQEELLQLSAAEQHLFDLGVQSIQQGNVLHCI